MSHYRPRRSMLYIPACVPRFLAKGRELRVDTLIFYLEESVLVARKTEARRNAAAALQEGADGTMGRSIIGGVLSSTVLTLVVVPVIYAMIEEFKARRAAKKAARRAASAGAAVSGAEVPAE